MGTYRNNLGFDFPLFSLAYALAAYLIIVFLALVLSCSNLIGYVKASRDQSKQISDMLGTAKTFAAVRNLI